MARTPQWIKTLGGHAGALFVAGELAKRGIPALLLPEGFSDDDVLAGGKDGSGYFYVQVKSCHPDRSRSFRLKDDHEEWVTAPSNSFVAFVWLGSPANNQGPGTGLRGNLMWDGSAFRSAIVCAATAAATTLSVASTSTRIVAGQGT